MKRLLLLLAFAFISQAMAQYQPIVRGMNLTELGNYIYDANPIGSKDKTFAQVAVDELYAMGVRHVVLNPRATMTNPKGNDLYPVVPAGERAQERQRYKRLIDYIHSKGMTVGMRPIFFVVKPDGTFPYVETKNGTNKLWWHGNIQPSDPNRWFESFKQYHDIYLLIAKMNNVEEYTIGAELYSMTVGIEDQWEEYQFGFPSQWLKLLRYTRSKLGSKVRIMYDVNFTDDSTTGSGELTVLGGEIERWRYRLVDLANPTDPAEFQIWKDLVDFWNELDAIGIDMYRSLASKKDMIPTNYNDLVKFLQIRTDEYANQIDTIVAETEYATGKMQPMIFKEAGFRSVNKGFINPFDYENGAGTYNEEHQAASYEALYNSFWLPRFPWFQGASFWDVSVSPTRNSGRGDLGFSPAKKPLTLEVLRRLYDFN